MSIHNLGNKIKGLLNADKTTLLYLLVIILVGTSSFGLGRLSVELSNNPPNSDIIITENNPNTSTGRLLSQSLGNVPSEPISQNGSIEKGKYVASKNGKLYYSIGCSGAKRIAVKNEIWFNNTDEAEKSGYTLSTSCH